MALLPELQYEYNERSVTDSFLGYDHRPKIEDGALYDAENLTTAHCPLLSNRKKRGLVRRLSAPGGILAN